MNTDDALNLLVKYNGYSDYVSGGNRADEED